MIIQSSEVNTTTSHEKSESRTFSSTSSINIGSQLTASNSDDSATNSAATRFAQLIEQLSNDTQTAASDEEGKNSILVMTTGGFRFRTAQETNEANEQELRTSIKMFQQLLQALSLQEGKALNYPNTEITDVLSTDENYPQDDASSVFNPGGISIQMSLNTSETVEEHESMSFNSSGTIKTMDGKNISFSLDMSMQRDYSYTSTTEFTQSVLFKDPLIINYPGESADLSDQKYAFDIDADGNEEMISFFNKGAMLALDKNSDGTINDGSELFGALSGNGFADLKAYDEDGNNYIDEADSIFNDLKLWTKTPGEDYLENLQSMNIGAIYLGATDTPFDLKGADNQFNGQVKSSSFYLTEDGQAGNIQQVDMVV
ncbi:MAG: hypothetical protein V7784_01630 [Oceanospirillaceae bacterium]